MSRAVQLAVSAALAGSCYLKPSWSNSPLRSPEGVRVTLAGQDCEDHSGSDGDPVSRSLGIQVRVENPTDQVLRIHEDEIRLVISAHSSHVIWASDLEVKPHTSAALTLSFTHRTMCYREAEFVIAWNDAFVLAGRPLMLDSLSFRP